MDSLTLGELAANRSWWKQQLSLGLVLQLLLTFGGWIVIVTTLRNVVSELERRVTIIEGEIVPRTEHDERDKLQEQKDKLLDERLSQMERQLDELLQQRK